MNDHKFTDEEIIKALKVCESGYCISGECPFYDEEEDNDIGACTSRLSVNALDLINRQRAELEELRVRAGLNSNNASQQRERGNKSRACKADRFCE